MSFLSKNPDTDQVFNNADSFSMAFDTAWKAMDFNSNDQLITKEDKIDKILESLKGHPYLDAFPQEAKQIAYFRIRLLNLA